MAKIQRFPKSRLKLNELLAAGRAIETKILSANADVLQCKSQFEGFQASLEMLSGSLLKLVKSIWTEKMNEGRKMRNKSRSSLFAQVRSFLIHSDETLRKAAQELIPLLDRYRNIYKRSYDDQTGYISNFVEAAKSDEFKDQFETLKLTGWVSDLETINNTCALYSANRKEELAQRNQPVKTSVSRAAFNSAYEVLVTRLNALAEVNGDKDFIVLFSWWNELIDSYRVIISRRSGKGKGGKTDKGESSRHDPSTGSSGEGGEEERPGEL